MPADLGNGSTPSKAKKAKKSSSALFGSSWKRIVADEGHVLKNPRAKSKSVAWMLLTVSDSGLLGSGIGPTMDMHW